MKWLIYYVNAFVFKENICDLLDCNGEDALAKWGIQVSVAFFYRWNYEWFGP